MRTQGTPLIVALALGLQSAIAALLASSSQAGDDVIAVIVNKANPASALDSSELRPIFQTRKMSWGSGGDAVPIDLPESNPLRIEFDEAVLGLDTDRVARYWKDRKIRGGARPPMQVPSSAAALKAVAAKEGAVGYVKASEANATVKIVARISGGKLGRP